MSQVKPLFSQPQTILNTETHAIYDRSQIPKTHSPWHTWTEPSDGYQQTQKIFTDYRPTRIVPPAVSKALTGNHNLKNAFAETRQVDPRDYIQTPMHQDCRICVIIPAYDEPFSFHIDGQRDPEDIGTGILRLLTGLSAQAVHLPKEQFEILIVINNSQDQAQKKSKEFLRNEYLYHALVSLSEGKIDPTWSEQTRWMAEFIIETGLKLHVMDKFSKDKAFKICNVGVVRDYGALEALRRFNNIDRNDGILVWNDADTRLSAKYLSSMLQVYDTNAEVSICDSHLINAAVGFDKRYVAGELYGIAQDYISDYLQKFWMKQHGVNAIPAERGHVIGGAKLNCRARDYLRAGGILHIPAAEDVIFSKKIQSFGKTHLMNQVVEAPKRISKRACGMGSMGWGVFSDIERATKDNPTLMTSSFIFAKLTIFAALENQIEYDQFTTQSPESAQVISEDLFNWMKETLPSYVAGDGGGYDAYIYERLLAFALYPALRDTHPPDQIANSVRAFRKLLRESLPEPLREGFRREIDRRYRKMMIRGSVWNQAIIHVGRAFEIYINQFENKLVKNEKGQTIIQPNATETLNELEKIIEELWKKKFGKSRTVMPYLSDIKKLLPEISNSFAAIHHFLDQTSEDNGDYKHAFEHINNYFALNLGYTEALLSDLPLRKLTFRIIAIGQAYEALIKQAKIDETVVPFLRW